jgi:hypothetical protein
MKSLIDYGTSLTFYLGIIFIVIATLIYVRKRINDLDAKANSMFDIISTMAREIQYIKAEMSGGEGGGHPQGMNLESALNTDDNTRDVLMSHFQSDVTGESSDDESSDDESSDDESGNDESGDDESGDDESGDDESGDDSDDEPIDVTIENINFNTTSNTTSNINDIDEDNEEQDEDNEEQDEDNKEQDEDNEEQHEDDENDENNDEENDEDNVKLIDFNENSIIDSDLNDVDLTDYNKKTTKELKELVSTKGLATEVNRIKRQQLIKLLQKQLS